MLIIEGVQGLMKRIKIDTTTIPILTFQKSIYGYAIAATVLLGVSTALFSGSLWVFMESLLLTLGFALAHTLAGKARDFKALAAGVITLLLDVFLGLLNFGLEYGIQYYLLTMCALLAASPKLNKSFLTGFSASIFALFVYALIAFRKIPPLYPLNGTVLYIYFNINMVSAFSVIIISLWMYTTEMINAQNRISDYHDEIYHIAHTDSLTGLANRKAIQEQLEYLYKKTRASDDHLVAGLLDVDNFKQVNDTYGHHCGDEALKIIARNLQNNLRQGDYVGRWGGEEFLIVIRTHDPEAAEKTFERIRQSIDKAPFLWEGKSIPLSITIGCTGISDKDTTDTAISRADRFLYEGKKTGKNKVVSDISHLTA